MEDKVCLERKSIADLVDTLVRDLSANRKGRIGRFAKELERLKAIRYSAIVVEGSRRDIHNHRYTSKVPPRLVEGMVNYIWVNSGVPTFWCDDAEMCAEAVYSILKQIYKKETSDGVRNEKATEENKNSVGE